MKYYQYVAVQQEHKRKENKEGYPKATRESVFILEREDNFQHRFYVGIRYDQFNDNTYLSETVTDASKTAQAIVLSESLWLLATRTPWG